MIIKEDLALRTSEYWREQFNMATHFKIDGLKASIEGKEILKGINLEIKGGEIHAIMGPNGTGKSTLASALMGHPKYEVTEGQ